jgi:hypothetical protein
MALSCWFMLWTTLMRRLCGAVRGLQKLWALACCGGRVRLGGALAEGFGEGAAQLLVVGLPFADALCGKLEPARPTAADTDPERYSLSGIR